MTSSIGGSTCTLGGANSTLGSLQLGGIRNDLVSVRWIGRSGHDDNTEEFWFGPDDGGRLIKLVKNEQTVLTRAQALQAKAQGAIMIVIGTGV